MIVFGDLINLVLETVEFILSPLIDLPALALLSLLLFLLQSRTILFEQVAFLLDSLVFLFGPDHFQLIIVHLRKVASTDCLIDDFLAHLELFKLLGHLFIFLFELLHLLL